MNLPKSPESTWEIGIFLIIAVAVYSLLYRTSAKAFLTRVSLRGRRDSTSKTPPRSISPEEKRAGSVSAPSDYNHALPPSRRESLLQLNRAPIRWREVDESDIAKNILPMTADYRNSPGNLYTPTGFSVDEIKALGDFPDYATLSGVPLPNAYPEHDVDKAKPRPYRPFRWNYHQTMCMCPVWQDRKKNLTDHLPPASSNQARHRLVDRTRKHLQESYCPTQRTIRQEWQSCPRRPPRF